MEFPPQFLTEPKIYVIAQTKPNRLSMDDAIAEILGEHTSDAWTAATIGEDDASVLTAFAAKTCYQSYGSGRNMQEHIEQLLSSYHGSTLAHFSMTFLITQVSRSLTHELVRHGIGVKRDGFAWTSDHDWHAVAEWSLLAGPAWLLVAVAIAAWIAYWARHGTWVLPDLYVIAVCVACAVDGAAGARFLGALKSELTAAKVG